MADKVKKPLWLRLILWIISSLLSIAVLLGIACAFLYIRYQINVFTVGKQIKTLNEEVKLERLLTNEYTADDMAYAKELIEIDPETNSYTIPEAKMVEIMTDVRPLKLTDKQIGAFMAYIVDSLSTIKANVGGEIDLKDYGFRVMQVDLTYIDRNQADFNVIVKVDLTKVKENMNKFPLNWLSKAIPQELYVSSTVTIAHGEDEFSYTTTSKGMSINNLSQEDTADIFKTFRKFIQIDSVDAFNKTLGDTFVNILIGTPDAQGLSYSLKPFVRDFYFETSVVGDTTTDYYVLTK